MTLPDIIAIVAIVLVIGSAVFYIIKAKKSGKKCIGCPDGCSCDTKKQESKGSACQGCCHCHEENE